MSYTPATDDQLLALKVSAGVGELTADPDIVEAVVRGIGEFAAAEWAPLNRIGDVEGARLENGVVRLPEGFAAAYRTYVAQGWNAIAAPEQFGGQGLPYALAVNALENLGTANLAFSLLPMLTVGAIEALEHHGTPAQQALYLPKLVSGEWAGTMNLTEPQAGSDVGALRTAATPAGDGTYRIRGQKIFITWGDHEIAENLVHLVLARLPDAPAGSRGISLFLVPKYRVNPDGSLGPRNDLKAVSLEHKLGIHASPTCVMSYGDSGDCVAEIVGAPNEGLKAMFTMMNSARINVGAQGVELGERALQQAAAYARKRVQSARAGAADKTPVAIVEHPDVRRMLLRMRALTEAARALLYYTAGQVDRRTARADLLVPLIKAWGTDVGMEVTSLGVQVHGGMGYIEETGAAQHFRDARIPPIYEGTNGIQAADLVTRKLALDDGAALAGLMTEIAADAGSEAPALARLAETCAVIGQWMVTEVSLDDRLAGSVPFCTMAAVTVAGWQMLRQKRAVEAGDAPALAKLKPVTARYFIEQVVPEAQGLEAAARGGAALLYALDANELT